jgi:CBS domain containing-hemolysin-like protein
MLLPAGPFALVARAAGAPAEAPPALPHPNVAEVAWLAAGVLALLLGNALFAAAETAFVGCRRTRLQQLQEEGSRGAGRATKLLEEPGRVLTAIELAGSTLRVCATLLTVFTALGAGLSLGATLLAAFFVFVLLFFGEFLAKALVVERADSVTILLAPFLDLFSRALYPVVGLLSWVTTRMARTSTGGLLAKSPFVTEEEIKIFAEQGVEAGAIEEEEKEMIHSIFDFSDTVVREVMVPRIDITAVEHTASLDEILVAILEEGHSRIPIYEDSIDNIVGILHARDVLAALSAGGKRAFDLKTMELRPPYFIPENKKLDELLQEFRVTKTPIAIVLDEYQGTAGLVTIEDVVEEIVGDIVDEWDIEEPQTRQLAPNVAVFDARAGLDDVSDYLDVCFPEEQRGTLGGFVFDLFGKLPSIGDTVQYQNLDLTVEKVDGHRILEVRVTVTERPNPNSDQPEGGS